MTRKVIREKLEAYVDDQERALGSAYHRVAKECLFGFAQTKEGLTNSRFHSEICSWGDPQGEFGEHPLVRELFRGVHPPSDGRCHPPDTRSLRPRQEPPSGHGQIRQAAADIQPVGILRQPPVSHFGPAEDPLDH